MPHSIGWPHQIPRQHQPSHISPNYRKNGHQQQHLNAPSLVHVMRPRKFLLGNSVGSLQIHPPQHHNITTTNHWCLKLSWACPQCLRVLWNVAGHVWTTTGGQIPTCKTIGSPRLRPVPPHPCPLVPQMATNPILPGCWKFRREICGSGSRQTSHEHPTTVSHPQNRLGRHPLFWDYPEVRLHMPQYQLEHDGIHKWGIAQVSTSQTQQNPTCTLPMGKTPVRTNHSVCKTSVPTASNTSKKSSVH